MISDLSLLAKATIKSLLNLKEVSLNVSFSLDIYLMLTMHVVYLPYLYLNREFEMDFLLASIFPQIILKIIMI